VTYSDDLYDDDRQIITDKYNKLVKDNIDSPKSEFYLIDMPHKPKAVESDGQREAIWVDVIEDESRVCEVAHMDNHPRPDNVEVVIKVIFDDFSEFFFPLIRKDSVYDNVMGDYMPNVERLNKDVTWNGDIKDFSVGPDNDEEKESISVTDMFGDSDDSTDVDDIDIEIDLEI